jgi:hypothetical protein
MRGPARLIYKLRNDPQSPTGSKASFELANFRDNLVDVYFLCITEAKILRDAVETRQRVDATDDIAIRILNVRYRDDKNSEEDTKVGKRGPLPEKSCVSTDFR